MRVIKRHTIDQSPAEVRTLSEGEARTLFEKSKSQQELLASLYGLWIECDCRSPVTIKRLQASGHYYIARVAGRAEHHNHCHFYSLLNDKSDDGEMRVKGNLNSFSFSMQVPTPTDKDVTQSLERTNKVARSDKLYCLVASLIESAHVNQISLANGPSYQREVIQISDAAKLYTLGNKVLKEYLFFGFGKYKQAVETLNNRADSWIGKHKAQAIILGHIDGVSRQDDRWVLHIKEGWDKKLGKKTMLTRLNGMFSLTKGPLLCAAVITELGKDKETGRPFYGITRCFISPVVSQNGFMLVDSDLERVAAKVAIGCILKKQNSDTTLIKPLTPNFIEGVAVLPDFLVKAKGATNVIEVMGKWDDELYQERKARTVPLMESLYGKVYTVGKSTSKNKEAFYKECLQLFSHFIE